MNECAPMEVLKAYVVGQARLGYRDFDPGPDESDVILATFPKSGSTWTSYLLHQIRSGGNDSFRDIKDEVVDITPGHWDPGINPFELKQRYFPRTFKTHGSYRLCPKGARYIYIARNPQDGFWSLYNFMHDLFSLEERVPIEHFFIDYYVDRFGTNHDIGNIWSHFIDWHPHRNKENVLWLHYEDLIADKATCIGAITRFMGIDLSQEALEAVLAHSEMSHMQTIASRINPSRDNRVGRIVRAFGPEMHRYAIRMKFGKMRRGIAGNGQDSLSENMLEQMNDEWSRRITPILGYRDYDEMRACCSKVQPADHTEEKTGRPRVAVGAIDAP